MQRSILATHRVLLLVWVLALGFVPVYVRFDHAGWDMNAYAEAKREMAAGNDPYLEGMRAQRQFYGTPSSARPRETPLPYLYPPITLPLLRALGGLGLPFWFWACGYWVVYGAGVLVQMYVGLQGAEQEERAGFLMLAAVLIYFPGLLKHDNLLGGNISFIVYGLVLAAALAGWRRGRWEWFYLMVFAASCFKLPWLTLLAIPVLSSSRQWFRACITAAAGVAVFALEWRLWPLPFDHWLEAVDAQFAYNGFGASPGGVIANALFHRGLPYGLASSALFVAYAGVVFAVLLRLSRRYRRGEVSFERWMPVMLLGVFLLNPRIKDYDLAPLTIAMGLILWRATASFATMGRVVWCCAVVAGANLVSVTIDPVAETWNLVACVLMIAAFVVGCGQVRSNRETETVLQGGLPAR